jgi:hypothetical protein
MAGATARVMAGDSGVELFVVAASTGR